MSEALSASITYSRNKAVESLMARQEARKIIAEIIKNVNLQIFPAAS
jgi:hypothetical protein